MAYSCALPRAGPGFVRAGGEEGVQASRGIRAMLCLCVLALACSLAAAGPAMAVEARAFQIDEDFSIEPTYAVWLQYYYYVPCPTYSWFWAFSGWEPGDIIGEWFKVGEEPTGGGSPAEPSLCREIEAIRVLDFAGYGVAYPGLFTVEFDIYCSDEDGCPAGPSLWNSGPRETGFGWNYIALLPPFDLWDCTESPETGARFLVTATHTGSEGFYPAWGTDNIGAAIETGCVMHESGCQPALYPRPHECHYATMHSGYYGQDFQYCPPRWLKDAMDSTSDASLFGFTELGWRIYLGCSGGWANQPTTWSNIKSIYK